MTPDTIDPYAAANSQAGLNKTAAVQSQEVNQTNQKPPYGSLTYNQTGTNADGTPQFTADSELTPQAQGVFNQYVTNQGGAAGAAGGVLNSGHLGSPVDLGQSATEGRLDALNRSTLDPQFKQQNDQLTQSLYDRGITPGSQGYDTAMRDFNQQKDDAYNKAYVSDYSTVNDEALKQQAGNLNAFNALQTGGQVATPSSSFVSTPQTQVQSPNLTGLVDSYNKNQIASQNATLGGLFGIGGALLNGGTGGFGSSVLGSVFGVGKK
jgi:hypothetical protein